MDKPSWERTPRKKEETFEEKVRDLMYKRRITYQEAAQLVEKGQKSIWEF